eukprot:scaffold5169_cov172-Amphora_coffeaeformis.AAC.13
MGGSKGGGSTGRSACNYRICPTKYCEEGRDRPSTFDGGWSMRPLGNIHTQNWTDGSQSVIAPLSVSRVAAA